MLSKCIELHFLKLPKHTIFDRIIDFDFVKGINGQIDCDHGFLKHKHFKKKLLFYKIILNPAQATFQNLIMLLEKYKEVFADSNEALPFPTDVMATIRTENDEPIYY